MPAITPKRGCDRYLDFLGDDSGLLGSLQEREEKVVRLYYGIGLETTYTLEEIVQRFNLTRDRVRQIKEKSLKRLRHPSRMRKLERFKA